MIGLIGTEAKIIGFCVISTPSKMGTLSLNCPFCCEEKFTSHNSLKYHILSMVDNIMCPACNCRCDDILDLADHLGRECKEKDIQPAPIDLIPQVNIKRETNLELPSPNEEVETNTALVNPKIEAEDNGYDKSILAKALSRTEEDTQNENEPPGEYSPAKVVYMCQMCNVNFTSIEEHLQKYHEGEEVIYVICSISIIKK